MVWGYHVRIEDGLGRHAGSRSGTRASRGCLPIMSTGLGEEAGVPLFRLEVPNILAGEIGGQGFLLFRLRLVANPPVLCSAASSIARLRISTQREGSHQCPTG
jgi:hypothetical protein